MFQRRAVISKKLKRTLGFGIGQGPVKLKSFFQLFYLMFNRERMSPRLSLKYKRDKASSARPYKQFHNTRCAVHWRVSKSELNEI